MISHWKTYCIAWNARKFKSFRLNNSPAWCQQQILEKWKVAHNSGATIFNQQPFLISMCAYCTLNHLPISPMVCSARTFFLQTVHFKYFSKMLSMCCICFNIMKYGYFTLVIQENLYLLVLHSTELLRMSLVMVIDAASMQKKCIATVDTVHLWWTYL